MSTIDTPTFVRLLRTATDDNTEFIERRLARRELFTALDAPTVSTLLGSASAGDTVIGIVAAAAAREGDDEGEEGGTDDEAAQKWVACLQILIQAICEGVGANAEAGAGFTSLLSALLSHLGDPILGVAVAQNIVDLVHSVPHTMDDHPLLKAISSVDATVAVDGIFQLLEADSKKGGAPAHDFREWVTGSSNKAAEPQGPSPSSVVGILVGSPILQGAISSLETSLGHAVAGDTECDVLLLSANLHVLGPIGEHQLLPASTMVLMMDAIAAASGEGNASATMEVEVVLPTILRSLSQLLRNPLNAAALAKAVPHMSTVLHHALGESTDLVPDAREVLLDVVAAMAASEALCPVACSLIEDVLPSVFSRRGASFGEVASALMVVAHFAGATHRCAPGGKGEVKRAATGDAIINSQYFNEYLWPGRTHHEVSVRRATWHAVNALVQNPITRVVAVGSAASYLANYAVHSPSGEEVEVRAAQLSCMTALLRCQEAATFHTKIAAEKARGLYPKGNDGAMCMAEETYQR